MYRIILFSLTAFLIVSCKEEESPKEVVTINEIPAVIPEMDEFDYDTLKGMYTGDFGGSDIRIILNYVSQSNAIGYNIHKGLQRNLSGTISRSGDSIEIILNEPGENEYDGVFTLSFIGNDLKPTGNWISNSGKISEKSFSLEKAIRPKNDGNTLTSLNFANRIDMLLDSLGHYYFSDDGMCRYEYYPDTEGAQQMIEILGSWSFEKDILTIDWQKNNQFKNSKSIFTKTQHEYDDYEGAFYFEGEGRTLEFMYW